MDTNKDDQHDLDKDPNQVWETYTQESEVSFWSRYEQSLEEARLIQQTFVPATTPDLVDSLALVHGDVFLECHITPKQQKQLRKNIRRQRNGISLPMRLIAPVVGVTFYSLNYAAEAMLTIGVDSLLAIGLGLGITYSAGTLIEDHLYINKKQKKLLGTQIKIKGEEIIVADTNQVIDLRYVDHLKYTSIGISLIPYREKQWKTTKPVLVIPKCMDGYDEIVKYIEAIIAKYRTS
ncbi:MAG TPA: hypothetical protein DCS93_14075 [Microscillaceae bacterium]|nr:hypothetical protein [Microscillaceae bacterium]